MPAARVVIRPAVAADAARIAEMAADLLAFEGKAPASVTAADVRRDGFGPKRAFSVLVAEQGRALLGYALYHPGYDPDSGSRGILVADLFVASPARRRGLGRALLAAVARECKRAGGNWLFWFVLPTNRAARAFYRRVGAKGFAAVPLVLDGERFEDLVRAAPRHQRRTKSSKVS